MGRGPTAAGGAPGLPARVDPGQKRGGSIKRQDGDLFNHNALLCHSLVEETAFFMLLGLPLFWLVIPRLVMSAGLTWMERFRRRVVRRSFRAGVA